MNKMIKTGAIVSIVVGAIEFGCLYGKGSILGVLKAYNGSAEDCIDALSSDKHKRSRFIATIAKLTSESKASKIES